MNHKEALKAIASWKGSEVSSDKLCDIALEALQSESEKTYTQAEFKEQVKFAAESYERGWGESAAYIYAMNPSLKEKQTPEPIQSLQPKTEEVERGWTITDRTVIDRQLEAIKIVMGNIKTKEQAIQFLKDAGIELEEEQPYIPTEKEETAHEFMLRIINESAEAADVPFKSEDVINAPLWKAHLKAMEEYAQLKANNSLEELEKWVKEECNGMIGSISKDYLLNKIQELKTKQ